MSLGAAEGARKRRESVLVALTAAENLYLERLGNRLELQKLREGEPRYGSALVEKLAAARPAAPGTAETLARERAETVRAALLERGGEASTGATGR